MGDKNFVRRTRTRNNGRIARNTCSEHGARSAGWRLSVHAPVIFSLPIPLPGGNEMMLATSANRLPFTDGVKEFWVGDPLLCSGMLRHYEGSGSGERKEKER